MIKRTDGERVLLAALEEIASTEIHDAGCSGAWGYPCKGGCNWAVAKAALADYAAISAQHIDHSPECFEAPGEGCVSGCPLEGK